MTAAFGGLRRPALRALVAAVPLCSLAAAQPGALFAQSSIPRMVEECVQGSGGLQAACEDAALLLQASHAGLGLLTTAGGALPASPSTAGRRLADRPRVVLDGGLIGSGLRWPDPGRSASGRDDGRKGFIGARAVTTVGIFDGFAPATTVGGVLAVDGVGSFRYLRLPEPSGFNGSVAAWGAGVRFGLLRESFSLPGVTVTATHQRVGTIRYAGDLTHPDGRVEHVAWDLSPRVSSVRAEVGKDLLALGITAGGAWDRYRGGARIAATRGPEGIGFGPPQVGIGETGDLRMNRRYFFLGVNFTWVVVQAAAELGWAGSPPAFVELDGTGPFRSDARSLQGALTLRVTY